MTIGKSITPSVKHLSGSRVEYQEAQATYSSHLASWEGPLWQPFLIKLSCLNLVFIGLQVALRGNHDGRSVVRHNFSSPKYARYIRVYPVAYKYRICMRMELYGCSNSKLWICNSSFSFLIKVMKNKRSGKLPVLWVLTWVVTLGADDMFLAPLMNALLWKQKGRRLWYYCYHKHMLIINLYCEFHQPFDFKFSTFL